MSFSSNFRDIALLPMLLGVLLMQENPQALYGRVGVISTTKKVNVHNVNMLPLWGGVDQCTFKVQEH